MYLFKLLILSSLLIFSSVKATVLTFDELAVAPGAYTALGNVSGGLTYGGLEWDSDWAISNNYAGSGYHSALSGTNFLSNGSNANNLSTGYNFDFVGASFITPVDELHNTTADWIQIIGYDSNNQIIGDTGQVAINDEEWLFIEANFIGAFYVDIVRDYGWFQMDNFVINEVANEVPEPSSLGIFLLVIAGLVLVRKKNFSFAHLTK